MRELAEGFVRFGGRRAALLAVLMLLAALSEGVGLALLAPLLAILTGVGGGALQHVADRAFGAFGVGTDGPRLPILMAAFVVAVALRALIVALRDRRSFDLQLDFVNTCRRTLMRLLAASRWSDIATFRHARITQALSGEIPRVAMAVQTMLMIALSLAMLAVQAVLVALLAPRLAMVAIVVILIAGIFSVPLTRRAYALGETGKVRSLKLVDIAAQLMGGLKLALAQNLAGAFVTEFEETLRSQAEEQRGYDLRRVRAQTASSIIVAAALASLVVAGHASAMPVASLLAALAVLSRMVGPATGLLQNVRLLAQALPSYQGLRQLERDLARSAAPLAPAPSHLWPGDRTICLTGISYHHPGGAGVTVDDVAIAPGTVVALVGPSGAGKTTFADLLSGLLTPSSGGITVGGVPLDDSAAAAWRDRIAYVAQDSYLFHDTVRRNLCWGGAALGDDRLWSVLERVEAAELVRGIEGGLDAMVAERGTRLSGGERQRLALARALLRRPDLLILDEATNAIDVATEDIILRRLISEAGGMTIVLASHRPGVIEHCSQIIAFDEHGNATASPASAE